MSNNTDLKICAVCGDKAKNKNFGALSCDSCKPFFRRHGKSNKTFVCAHGGKCVITVNTRNNCKKCRMDKCLDVGMKKELILNEEEKKLRHEIIEKNKKERVNIEMLLDELEIRSSDSGSDSLSSDNNNNNNNNNKQYLAVSINDQDEQGSIELTESITDQDIEDVEVFIRSDEIIQNSCKVYEQTVNNVIERPFENIDRNFNVVEEYKLNELWEVLPKFERKVDWLRTLFEVQDVKQMIAMSDLFYQRQIKRFIKSIKQMNVFQHISDNDKHALVKYGCNDIFQLRGILLFDPNEGSWVVPISDDDSFIMRMELMYRVLRDAYNNYTVHLLDIIKELDSDLVVINLLTAIALFNPTRPCIIDKESIQTQQCVYLHLLRRYLRFKYRSRTESEHRFDKVLNTLVVTHVMCEYQKVYFMQQYQDYYSPLSREILFNSD